MVCQFHGVVQYAPDDNALTVQPAVDQEMSGASHDTGVHPSPVPAQRQVPGVNLLAQLGPLQAAWSGGLVGNIAQPGHDERLVTLSGRFSELLVSPGQNVDDVRSRRGGKPIMHLIRRLIPSGGQPQLADVVIKLVVRHIVVLAGANIRPAFGGCLFQDLKLDRFPLVALLDNAKAFTQHLAGILIAT